MPARLPAMPLPRTSRVATLSLAALLAGGLAACSPESAPAPPTTPAASRTEGVSYGTIIGTRPLAVRGEAVGPNQAVEFTVRQDDGSDVQVAQANEERLQAGDRVAITRSQRTWLARASGGPSPTPQAQASSPAR
ncbi:hypothetical protein [Roseomonas xinghualingensis]|uniref:hypothetical protein n=1 Tax=Roseomonas xinghualingensis TaxID=2986475 RepID=UPI0021F0BF64|nr:hypothetical protein [Roseomonas sp. SXEYE001]MCV4208357.1 hypothetical protein [Roseomonas sp. SXEYE001]